mgnify:CR=1 FL=1
MDIRFELGGYQRSLMGFFLILVKKRKHSIQLSSMSDVLREWIEAFCAFGT